MPPRKQIYKITYPNGKIYMGMDLIGMLLKRRRLDHDGRRHRDSLIRFAAGD